MAFLWELPGTAASAPEGASPALHPLAVFAPALLQGRQLKNSSLGRTAQMPSDYGCGRMPQPEPAVRSLIKAGSEHFSRDGVSKRPGPLDATLIAFTEELLGRWPEGQQWPKDYLMTEVRPASAPPLPCLPRSQNP